MVFFLLLAIIPGIVCMFISRKFKHRINKMDAEYSGDIIPDKETEAWYQYERLIRYRIMKATENIGFIFFYFAAAMLLVLIIESIS